MSPPYFEACTQKGEWLGFAIDTVNMEFTVPPKKVYALLALLRKAENSRRATPRFLAKIAGTIVSMGIAIGPASRLFT